jgi:hypothetical protein
MHMDNGIEFPLRRLCRAGIPPRRQASLTPGGQDGRPTITSTLCRAGIRPRHQASLTHGAQDGRPTFTSTLSFTSTLCRAGILPRHQASSTLAANMAALHWKPPILLASMI